VFTHGVFHVRSVMEKVALGEIFHVFRFPFVRYHFADALHIHGGFIRRHKIGLLGVVVATDVISSHCRIKQERKC